MKNNRQYEQYVHESLLGYGIEEARTILGGYRKQLRVTKVGDKNLIVTADYNPNRLNVEVEVIGDGEWKHSRIVNEIGWG